MVQNVNVVTNLKPRPAVAQDPAGVTIGRAQTIDVATVLQPRLVDVRLHFAGEVRTAVAQGGQWKATLFHLQGPCRRSYIQGPLLQGPLARGKHLEARLLRRCIEGNPSKKGPRAS